MPQNSSNDNDIIALSNLKNLIFDTPEAVQTKIQLIKEEIASDRYEVNCQHIAAKMVEHAPLAEEEELEIA